MDFTEQYLQTIDEVIAAGPYKDSWDSLAAYRVPEWYRQAKFGLFIHWGIYSVPAFGSEWYSRNMYIQGTREFEHHVKTYGPHKNFGYKDFIPMFTASAFDPEEWAGLFAESGARYIVPVAEHHDGFQMYKSELSHWNAAEMGPKRDILGELKEAFEKHGLKGGASSHRIEHWFFMGHGREFESDMNGTLKRGDFYWPAMEEPKDHFDTDSKPSMTKEFLDDWMVRTCELIDRYRPAVIYFDWWILQKSAAEHLRRIAAYYYNRAASWGQEVVINYKQDSFAFGTAVPDVERGVFSQMKPFCWQTDTSVARNSWGYTEGNNYKDPEEIIQYLADVVSKNGNLLLNIGPRADGTIPEEGAHILREIGKWLRVNGEAIYDTGVWREYGEGPVQAAEGAFSDGKKPAYTERDFRYTCRGSHIYAIAMKEAADGCYRLTRLGSRQEGQTPCFEGIIEGVELLGSEKKPQWRQEREGLSIQAEKIRSAYPVVFKITVH